MSDVQQWLKEGMMVNVQFYQGKAVGIEVPTFVELEVVETEPGVRVIPPKEAQNLLSWKLELLCRFLVHNGR